MSSSSSLSSPTKESFMMAVMGLPARERERRWCIDCHAELGGPAKIKYRMVD